MATNYPTSLDSFTNKTDNVDNVMAADINDVQDAVEALEAKLGIDGSVDTDSIDYKVNNFFATGRTLLLYENTAPTGWTIQNTLDDKLVYVTKGSAAGGQTGGTVHSSGTWQQPNHTLTISEMPSHGHDSYIDFKTSEGTAQSIAASQGQSQYTTLTGQIGSTGGGQPHNHGSSWRPAAYCCIMVKKD